MSDNKYEATDLGLKIRGMLRACICADDTALIPEKMFIQGTNGIGPTLEVAEILMNDLLNLIDGLETDLGNLERSVS